MKLFHNSKPGLRLGLPLLLGALSVSLLSCALVEGADATSGGTKSSGTNAVAAKAPPKKLSGAELYSIHCARCHPERYPTERTAAQWKTILMHMRIRANLPAEQARTILKYLQENSGR